MSVAKLSPRFVVRLALGSSLVAICGATAHAQTVPSSDAASPFSAGAPAPVTSATAGTTNPAAQQEVTAPASAAGSAGDEIIVTASKRQATLQDTPISVSVTSAATIEQAQIRDLIDLQTVVPSLRVQQGVSSAGTNFFIRGFGNGAGNAGIEPSVGVFIDGVYRSRSAAEISDLTNITRIEVLRGPQSTLFGKNASAGVISIVTQKPQFDFGGSAEFTYGNYNSTIGKIDVTGPIIKDVLAFDINGGVNRRDGYAHDLYTGSDINNRNRYNFGGQLLFTPTPDLSVRLIGDYSNIDEICCNVVNVLAGPTTPAVNALTAAAGRGPGLVPNSPFSDTQRTNLVPRNKIENYGGSGQIDWKLHNLTLTSITAYRELKAHSDQDGDFTTASIIGDQPTFGDIDTFTQEVRVASDFKGPINFLVGGFYFDENIRTGMDNVLGTDARPYLDLLSGGALGTVERILGRPAGSFFAPGTGEFASFRQHDRSYSFFGTVDFKPTDKLTLTGGLNYTDDAKRVSSNTFSTEPFAAVDLVALGTALGVPPALANTAANPLLPLRGLQFQPPFLNFPNAVESGRTNDSNVSYTARASYKFDRHWNVYVTYATGFKPTSFNLSNDSRPFAADFVPGSPVSNPAPSAIRSAGLALPNLTSGTRYAGPERSRVIEGGVKMSFPQASFNFDVFQQDIKGFQQLVFTGTGFGLSNAGKESVYGFEFDGSATPVPPLTLFASVTYLRPLYDSYPASTFGNLSGVAPANIPSINASVGAALTEKLNEKLTLILRTDFNYTSPTRLVDGEADFGANALIVARNYKQEVEDLNLSATLKLPHGIELSGFARNVLNNRYLIQIFPGVAQSQSIEGFANQPRTYGGSVRYKF